TDDEIYKTMDDARSVGVDIITLGQYMQPTKHHLRVERFVTPQQFEEYRKVGREKGVLEVASGPRVRSSDRADRVFKRHN
ncbi:lipoyl synthase, partial [Francisella tularensis subsp. holarctica]|nr:lipoyl synthase [Francisella tularensis subsp. holarctica]